MKYIYPAVFVKEETGFFVNFPDLKGCYTDADDLATAYERAKDVLCLVLYNMEDKGGGIPAPSDIQSVKTGENEFSSLIDCDTMEYRKFYDKRAVKKTLSIPSWLNTMAENSGMNFSQVLQDALKQQLGV